MSFIAYSFHCFCAELFTGPVFSPGLIFAVFSVANLLFIFNKLKCLS